MEPPCYETEAQATAAQVCSILALLSRFVSSEFLGTKAAPAASSRVKAFRAGETGILLPPPQRSIGRPRGFGWLARGRPEGASVPRDPPDSGDGRCPAAIAPATSEPPDRICPDARHLQLAEPRARARRGRGRGGGGARTPTPRRCQTHADPPLPAYIRQPTAPRCWLLCKSAEASAFIDKSRIRPSRPPFLSRLLPFPPLDSLPLFSAV